MDEVTELNRRANLTADRHALLEKRIRGEIPSRGSGAKIPRRSNQSIAPLSLAQESQWMLQQLQPENTVLNTFRALRVARAIDQHILELALAEVARRHDVLRTNFRVMDGVPVQVIRPVEPVSVGIIDLSRFPVSEREAEFVRWSRKRTVEPFDLATGELLRADLVRLGEEDHVVFFNLHHIICDGWSLGIIVRETMTLYNALSKGKPSPLLPLQIQYGDYSAWQRSTLQSDVIERQIKFWKTHLTDAPTLTELPFDRPRPPDRSFRGQRRGVTLDRPLVTRLRLLCQREQTTLFTVMISALAILFHRYSGATDVVIGSPVANRGFREVEPLIGLFMNTVTFRFDLRGDPTFKDFLARARDEATDVFNNQDVPFERVLNELGIKREKDRSPLFQTMIAMQPPRAASVLAELGVDPAVLTPRGAKFDFTLVLWESEDGDIGGVIEYATDLFEPATIERLFKHYLTLLDGITVDPQRRISALPMLSEDERHGTISLATGPEKPYPQSCLHELVAKQAACTPEAVALVYGTERITYRGLEERANQLAWHLKALGVSPDTIVGLCIRRSPSLVITILGILKAGGAYLPLDPSYPPHRLAQMVVDARPSVLVTEASLLALPSQQAQAEQADINWAMTAAVATLRRIKHRVLVDAEAAAIATHPTIAPAITIQPDNLAYILYTSGSTGRPKGVMGTHRAIVNRLYWDVPQQAADEVYAHRTTPNFIDALWEIFMPLLRGQSVVIVPEDVARDPAQLIDLLSREGVTRIVLVPSLLRAILDSPNHLLQRLHKLVHWACSGEALSAPLAATFRKKLPGAKLFNIYGTSEFWDATWFAVGDQYSNASVPIGAPIANMRAQVLHGGYEPAAMNVAGDLYIGGVGLARGYLGSPGMTADRFRPDPFGDGARIYCSGDRVRRLPNGVLEFIGRKDRQVKVRGHRIELSEIERVLERHPIVRNATVQLRDDLPCGEPGLVAYIASDVKSSADDILRAHLQAELPSHMIPVHFVLLTKLPLTPNGKIDRAGLPSPKLTQPQLRKHIAPKTAAEQMLAGIWSEVLGIPEIGIDDNFFERGGDSLMLVRVQSVINERLHKDIPVTIFFRYPTIRALSSYLAEGQKTDSLVQSTSRGQARKKFLARRAHAG